MARVTEPLLTRTRAGDEAAFAARLVISPATVKANVSRAMVKLHACDRAQLVVLAYEAGLVRPGFLA